MKTKLPKILYVYKDHDPIDIDEGWFMTGETIRDCADITGPRIVGVYELKELKKVSLEVKEELTVNDAKIP